ncbi:MAG: class D beta-lactamase [Bacteroidales bacterium]|nr:class D beta-lactamase [Bacteroidales bacterium]MCF8455124.1 class D beta-lactamase [Bacteroidales bacterium]
MKTYHLLIIAILISACSPKQNESKNKDTTTLQKEILKPGLQAIIDSAQVNGAVLVFDPQQNVFYSNDFQWARKGNLPASTFKIPNSIIALETGVVEDDSTLFIWDGKNRNLAIWEQDLIFRDAFHYSCVPCYQDIARRIGEKRMNEYLAKLDYGKMQVDSTNIDLFWLEGESKISQFQQIDFLNRFYNSNLQVSDRTQKIMKELIVIERNDLYTLRGKTGWSIRNGNNNGWFVGYVETRGKIYFFATNVEPYEEFNMDIFPKIRTEITYKALTNLGILSTILPVSKSEN